MHAMIYHLAQPPLAHYMQSPEGELHAFQLIPADSSSADAPSAGLAGSRHPEPLVLAASTAANKSAWMESLSNALASRSPGVASSLETQLAAASISG